MKDLVNVSLRECRLVTYRVLWQAGAPTGVIPPVVDATVAALGSGLPALDALSEDADVLGRTAAVPVSHRADGVSVTVEARGKHALAVFPDLVDLAAVAVHRAGSADVTVRGTVRAELLAALPAVAAESGLTAEVVMADEDVCRARFGAGECSRAAADRILRDGIDVDADLWWSLFHLGNLAMTPDSVVSRRHTGRSVFDEHGHIIGEIGEDLEKEGAR